MLKKQFLKSKSLCKVTFSLPKEAVNEAREVRILGEFNGWKWENGVPMKATKQDFKAVVELETGREYQFRYLVNNQTWENDWAADDYQPTPFGVENSVVFVEEILDIPAKAVKGKTTSRKKATTKAGKDDLKKIEGVGPKIEKLLNEAGISTFSDLSKAKMTLLKKVLENAGNRFRMHNPETWPVQAKLAVEGNWTKLEKLQKELKGGKK